MSFEITKVMVWSAEIEDRPGAAAEKLRALAQAGVDLQFVLGRRENGGSGKGILYVAPLRGKRQEEAAEKVGFAVDINIVAVKIDGANKQGLGSRMAEALADSGININGFNGLVTGSRFAAFITFDNTPDAERGLKALRRLR